MRPVPPARPRHTGPTTPPLRLASLRLAVSRLASLQLASRLLLSASVSATAACAASVAPVPAAHPASPDAPTGRLAGAPPSLRPGVVRYADSPGSTGPAPALDAPPAPGHHHHTPDAPATAPTSPAASGHHHAP